MSFVLSKFVGDNFQSLKNNNEYSVGVFRENDSTSLVQITSTFDTRTADDLRRNDNMASEFNGTIFRVSNNIVQSKLDEVRARSPVNESSESQSVKLVCRGIPKTVNYNETLETLDIKNVKACYDGTTMRLWWNSVKGKWELSTTRRIHANKSFWGSNKSFERLFNESVQLDYNSLSTNCDYTFVLLHPENCVVIQNNSDPTVIHISTFDHLLDSEVDFNVKTLNNETVLKAQVCEGTTTWDDVKTALFKLNRNLRGLIVQVMVGEKMYNVKCETEFYKELVETRGNTPTILERYIQLKHENPAFVPFLTSYYPQSLSSITEFESRLMNFVHYLQKTYYNVFVKHRLDLNRVDEKYHKTLKCLHYYYKHNKTPTTLNQVKNYLESLNSRVLLSVLY